MGSVWCKRERDPHHSHSFSTKLPFNATLSRWTSQVCQAYRRPRDIRRPNIRVPPKPPPPGLSSRPSISNPRPVGDNGGWQTATLCVPDSAPVPPPRKKKRYRQELQRMALSMDELNRPTHFGQSYGRANRIQSEEVLLSTSRLEVLPLPGDDGYRQYKRASEKENHYMCYTKSIDRFNRDADYHNVIVSHPNRLTRSQTEGDMDKTIEITDVSEKPNLRIKRHQSADTSSRFIGRSDLDYSSRLDTVADNREINYVTRLSDTLDEDTDRWKDENKKLWMQNILCSADVDVTVGSRHNVMELRRHSETTFKRKVLGGDGNSGEPNSLPYDRLHLMHAEEGTAVPNSNGNKTPPTTPELPSPDNSITYDNDRTHSVFLEMLKRNKSAFHEPETNNAESILEQKYKTNFIYESTANEKPFNYTLSEPVSCNNSFTDVDSLRSFTLTPPSLRHSKPPSSLSNTQLGYRDRIKLGDCSFKFSKSLDRNIREGLTNNTGSLKLDGNHSSYISALRELDFVKSGKVNEADAITSSNTDQLFSKNEGNKTIKTEINQEKFQAKDITLQNGDKTKENCKDSRRSSKSSITESLHEFEMSIYDMLKESKVENHSSDEGEQKVVKNKINKNKIDQFV